MIQEADQITHAWKESPVARIQPAEVILVTDFDGTLAEIVQDPAGASARPEALGRKVIEVHAPKAGKGSALAALIPNEDPGGVICFGDDENDRPMFEYVSTLDVPHWSVGVWSPEAPSRLFDHCDLVVPGPA